MSTEEHNEATYRTLVDEGFCKGKVDAVAPLFAAGFIEHQVRPMAPGFEGIAQLITMLHAGYPDMHHEVVDLHACGDKVWARLVARGTHTGSFLGIPPSGNKIEIDIVDICRFADGKIAEHWGVADRLTMMEQLGAIPKLKLPARAA